jgi:hypothetical protein
LRSSHTVRDQVSHPHKKSFVTVRHGMVPKLKRVSFLGEMDVAVLKLHSPLTQWTH